MTVSHAWFRRAAAVAAAAGALFASGCDRHPAPPLERTDLVLRFFRSIRNGDFQSAARQGDKIHQLDNYNSAVKRLIAIQEGNSYIRRAQEALNRGDLATARAALEEGCRHFPGNHNLMMLAAKVRQLRNAEKLLANMKKAKSSSAMSAALTAATIGLSANLTPKLKTYFSFYESEIARVEAKEREERRRQIRESDAFSAAIPEPAVGKKNSEPSAKPSGKNAAPEPEVGAKKSEAPAKSGKSALPAAEAVK